MIFIWKRVFVTGTLYCHMSYSIDAVCALSYWRDYYPYPHRNNPRQPPVPLVSSLIASFMGSTWGPAGADRTQVGPMWATWKLLSGILSIIITFGFRCFRKITNYWECTVFCNPWVCAVLSTVIFIFVPPTHMLGIFRSEWLFPQNFPCQELCQYWLYFRGCRLPNSWSTSVVWLTYERKTHQNKNCDAEDQIFDGLLLITPDHFVWYFGQQNESKNL